jgi:hypothetical protein
LLHGFIYFKKKNKKNKKGRINSQPYREDYPPHSFIIREQQSRSYPTTPKRTLFPITVQYQKT